MRDVVPDLWGQAFRPAAALPGGASAWRVPLPNLVGHLDDEVASWNRAICSFR